MKAQPLSRFSISIQKNLLKKLDTMVKGKGFQNRSQAISNIVRDSIIEHTATTGTQEIAGTVTLVYDHHKANLLSRLTAIQHDHGDIIVSALHVHLDHHNCMEVLAVKGLAEPIRRMADTLIATKGVKHGKLTVTTTGHEFV